MLLWSSGQNQGHRRKKAWNWCHHSACKWEHDCMVCRHLVLLFSASARCVEFTFLIRK